MNYSFKKSGEFEKEKDKDEQKNNNMENFL